MIPITNPQLLERVDAYLKGITPSDIVCIIHDTDPDGICSAVIIAKCIEHLRRKKIDIRIPLDKANYGLNDAMIKKIKQKKVTKVITTDFSAEQNLPLLKEIEKQATVLVIDHHKLYNDYKSPKTILYKPQFFTTIEPSTYCTGKLAYDAANRVVNLGELDWMAAAACISDIATAPWLDWLAGVFKRYNVVPKSYDPNDLFQTLIGQVSSTISSTEVYDVKLVPKCFDVFYTAKGPQDILDSQFGKYKRLIDKELQKHLALFETKAEKHSDTYIYDMNSKYRIHSPLSTLLGLKYPNRTILIINSSLSPISVSARRGDKKLPVNLLLENAIKGFENANAGGHTPAAGAGFPKKYLKEFKQRICEASKK